MQTKRTILIYLLSLLAVITMSAQDVIVTLTPARQIMPPQALLYISDPGKYFSISLTNTTNVQQNVYLAFQLEKVVPATPELSLIVPSDIQPRTPITIPANSTRNLTPAELKVLFNHIPSNRIAGTQGLFNDYMNGSFGLLPEGDYVAHMTAYRWTEPKLPTPDVVSDANGGVANFTVCYNAKEPKFMEPLVFPGAELENVASVDVLDARFSWMETIIPSHPELAHFKYSFKVVELLEGRDPDFCMQNNPVVYKVDNLMIPQCRIPTTVIQSVMKAGKVYVAQVTASNSSSNIFDYTVIENGGKSDYRLFQLKTPKEIAQEDVTKQETIDENENKNENGDGDEDEDENASDDDNKDKKKDDIFKDDTDKDGNDDDLFFAWGDVLMKDSVSTDSLYTYRNPKITKPYFMKTEVRKTFLGEDIIVAWDPVDYLGGEGHRADTIKVEYEVQLFNGRDVIDKAAALEGEPIYKFQTEECTDTITWEKIGDLVQSRDYLVLRVKPVLIKGQSVCFTNDSINVLDMSCVERLAKKYFQCSNTVEITNTSPTTKSAKDFEGEVVALGQYNLTIDKITGGDAAKGFKGEGRVEWNPMGLSLMMHVKFDTLQINTDDIVYGGIATTMEDPSATSNNTVVEKLFSDYGIDNLISDTGIPYAGKISSATEEAAKGIAAKVGLKDYYEYVSTTDMAWDMLTSGGKAEHVYMPLALPKEVTEKLPVDIQISTMKFAPAWATMDIIGEFTLPNSDYTEEDILVFGAPRICISPDRLLPESGTLALLSDLTVVDPNSSYKIKFKAPQNVIEPTNGCFASWHDDKFEMLGIDVDMTIPNLKKVVDGKATDDNPVLTITTSISDWDDLLVEQITMDPFEAEDLPGYTFTASDVVVDYSLWRNSSKMGNFPEGYDVTQVVTGEYLNNTDWKGLYIKEVAVEFPEDIKIGNGKDRMNIAAKGIYIDNSGVTMKGGIDHAVEASTGGWSFNIDEVGINVIQNNFDKCYLSGTFGVPALTDDNGNPADIDYYCQIRRQSDPNDKKKKLDQYAYIFAVQQEVENLNLDMFLAKVKFDKKQTYFLVESDFEADGTYDEKGKANGERKTRVELVMGGDMEIGGKASASEKLKISIPDIHFSGLRIANCAKWESKYVNIQDKPDTKKVIKKLTEGKEFHNDKETFFFHTGAWSLASMQKKVGPFEFTLQNYNIDFQPSTGALGLSLAGEVALCKGLDISAGASVKLNSKIEGISDILNNPKDLKFKWDGIVLDSCKVHTSFCGITLDGSMTLDSIKGDGFDADLKVALPGDLFKLDCKGAYYRTKDAAVDADNFTWGYLYVAMESKAGIPIPPVQINGITGGFYFNCSKNEDNTGTAKEGCIGVVLGMTIASVDGKTFSGDFDVTVVYDKNLNKGKGGLSDFNFTGDMKVAEGLINTKVTLLYANSDESQYFQLNVTVDGSVGDVGGLQEKVSALDEKLKALNEEFDGFAGDVKAGLADKIGEGKSGNDKKAVEQIKNDVGKEKKDAKDAASNVKVGELQISLDVKITTKENGVKLNKTKWHVWLGKPSEDERCSLVLIDYGKEGDIVQVKIGANAYLCAGNELPDDGKLPPIPAKITQFLDGTTKGAGVQSDDVSAANNARDRALASFNGSVAGGVMLGAQAYGSVSVDLGLLYGSMDAIAGFDVALRKYENAFCLNNPDGTIGWNGWYGEGQLYAYLAANFGLNINLGFYQGKIDILDAGIGGVLQFGGPKPTYFMGKARVKVNLLNGLFCLNKKFEFECGEVCRIFHGNALDDFNLFDECSIGDSIRDNGWDKDLAINPRITKTAYVTTVAPLNQHFRVLDENELDRIKEGVNVADKEQLEMQANRTFIFRMDEDYVSGARLYQYSKTGARTDYPGSDQVNIKGYQSEGYIVIPFKGDQPSRHSLDMAKLNSFLKPNKYYRLVISGKAKEVYKGQEVDPFKFDVKSGRNINKEWKQAKSYYFCTGDIQEFTDTTDLQDYVAIAYPSELNNLQQSDKSENAEYMNAYLTDVQAPTIALTEDISNTAYKDGKLYWRLLDKNGREISREENRWVIGDNTCNMEPARRLNAVAGKYYTLSLDYYVATEKKANTIDFDTVNIASMRVHTLDESQSWRTGYKHKILGRRKLTHTSLGYEKSFLGIRLDAATFANVDYTYTDQFHSHKLWDVSFAMVDLKVGGQHARLYDPFHYMSYISNYAFIGGWEVNYTYKTKIQVTTSESAIIHVPNSGKYEGRLGKNGEMRVKNGIEDIKKLIFYDKSQWHPTYGDYPLPAPTSTAEDYLLTYDPRSFSFTPADNAESRVATSINFINGFYDDVQTFSERIHETFAKSTRDYQGEWYNTHVGTYVTTAPDANSFMTADTVQNFRISIPTYQFYTLLDRGTKAGMNEYFAGLDKNTHYRDHYDVQSYILDNMAKETGASYSPWNSTNPFYYPKNSGKNLSRVKETFDAASAKKNLMKLEYTVYRVNAYNYANGQYSVNTKLMNGDVVDRVIIDNPLSSSSVSEVPAGSSSSSSSGISTSGSVTPEESSNLDKLFELHRQALAALDDSQAKQNETDDLMRQAKESIAQVNDVLVTAVNKNVAPTRWESQVANAITKINELSAAIAGQINAVSAIADEAVKVADDATPIRDALKESNNISTAQKLVVDADYSDTQIAALQTTEILNILKQNKAELDALVSKMNANVRQARAYTDPASSARRTLVNTYATNATQAFNTLKANVESLRQKSEYASQTVSTMQDKIEFAADVFDRYGSNMDESVIVGQANRALRDIQPLIPTWDEKTNTDGEYQQILTDSATITKNFDRIQTLVVEGTDIYNSVYKNYEECQKLLADADGYLLNISEKDELAKTCFDNYAKLTIQLSDIYGAWDSFNSLFDCREAAYEQYHPIAQKLVNVKMTHHLMESAGRLTDVLSYASRLDGLDADIENFRTVNIPKIKEALDKAKTEFNNLNEKMAANTSIAIVGRNFRDSIAHMNSYAYEKIAALVQEKKDIDQMIADAEQKRAELTGLQNVDVTGWTVTLDGCNARDKYAVNRVLKEYYFPEYSDPQIMDIIYAAPIDLMRGATKAEATLAKSRLENAGASVTISGPEDKVSDEPKEGTIVLVNVGGNKLKVIQLVKNIAGLGLAAAKTLVESAPCIVVTGLDEEKLLIYKQQFVDLGAEVELK